MKEAEFVPQLLRHIEWDKLADMGARSLAAFPEPHSGLPKLQEECAEVAVEVARYRSGRSDKHDLACELADNLLMIVQALHIVGPATFAAALEQKYTRHLARLEQKERELAIGGQR